MAASGTQLEVLRTWLRPAHEAARTPGGACSRGRARSSSGAASRRVGIGSTPRRAAGSTAWRATSTRPSSRPCSAAASSGSPPTEPRARRSTTARCSGRPRASTWARSADRTPRSSRTAPRTRRAGSRPPSRAPRRRPRPSRHRRARPPRRATRDDGTSDARGDQALAPVDGARSFGPPQCGHFGSSAAYGPWQCAQWMRPPIATRQCSSG